ncbi:MAG TPA: UTP--glucose-1-phosphate uridylyltransferase GalU [Gammaproteobacteria bacterium]|nr:UTP--glucose-1-phosphate uridylyltransferase GalU [Gammaproteobacteria bacterium]
MNNAIRKAVFPVAGLGTRFLPATKANPKEMLPVVDKPLIQYAAEEAVAAGIDVLIFVTGRSKRSIPDHFDKAYELEVELKTHNKRKMLSLVREILPANVSCVYIRQAEALGLGHAVLCARPVVGNEPFAVILADDLIYNDVDGCLSQMVDIYKEHGCGLIGVQAVPKDDVHSYGIVEGEAVGDRLWKINSMVEKPQPSETSSNIAVVGRYILTPSIFDLLTHVKKGAGGEIQLTDAIARQLQHEEVLAYEFLGKRYDCGNKLGYLEATVEYALKHPELHARFREYLKNLDYKSIAR